MDDMTPEDFLPSDARERLERVRAAARAVLRDDYKARDFLARPHPLLDQRRPVDLVLAGEDGTRRVERILECYRRPPNGRMPEPPAVSCAGYESRCAPN